MSSLYEDLERLDSLKKQGIITEEEFLMEKKRILSMDSGAVGNSEDASKKVTIPQKKADEFHAYGSYHRRVFERFEKTFIECKANNTRPKWDKLSNFNWCAFLFFPVWFLYKRNWGPLFLAIVVAIVSYTAESYGVANTDQNSQVLSVVLVLVCNSINIILWLYFARWGDLVEYYKAKTGGKRYWLNNGFLKDIYSRLP